MYRHRSTLILPSPWWLARIGARIARAAEGLGSREAASLFDALGDLSLALVRRPASAWATPPERAAQHMEAAGWSAAPAIVEVAVGVGLWVALPDGRLRPAEPEVARYLAARRMAATEDAAGDMEQRLRGDLFDVVPMAVALAADLEGQADLVQLLAGKDGPFEDALELAAAQAALALSWGAAVASDLRRALLDRALIWTNPGGSELHRMVGTAALATESRGGPFAEEVQAALTERLQLLLPDSRVEGDEVSEAAIARSLESTLASLAAGFEDAPSALKPFVVSAGIEVAILGRVLPWVWSPGERLDRALLSLAERHREGEASALLSLQGISTPSAQAEGLVQGALKAAREDPEDEHEATGAVAAAHAVARWDTVGELTAHLLARLVVAPVAFDVRVACATALAAHPGPAASARAMLMPALDGRMAQDEPIERGASVAALLALGSDDPAVAALAVGLVADGAPSEVFGELLVRALGRQPRLVAGIREAWAMDEPDLQLAVLALLEPLGRRLQLAEERGPFLEHPPISHRARLELLEMVLPLAGRIDDPELAEPAAILAGWLGRGDLDVAETLRVVRQAVEPPMMGALDLALGGVGAVTPELVGLVATDVAHGAPPLAAMAAPALSVMATHIGALDPADPLVPIYRARLDYEGPQQEPIRDLLIAMALLPWLPAD